MTQLEILPHQVPQQSHADLDAFAGGRPRFDAMAPQFGGDGLQQFGAFLLNRTKSGQRRRGSGAGESGGKAVRVAVLPGAQDGGCLVCGRRCKSWTHIGLMGLIGGFRGFSGKIRLLFIIFQDIFPELPARFPICCHEDRI
jgi:hypothetical protein